VIAFRAVAAVAAVNALAGCRGAPPKVEATGTPPPAPNALVVQAREALARAESAPLPTPPPPPSPRPRGFTPLPAPDLKPEEIEAIRLLEQAAAAEPGRREAHELLARVLEPLALRRHERAVAARGRKSAPPAPPDQGVDVSPARVARAYRAAIDADTGAADLIEPLIAFASKVEDLDSMEWAHMELIRRAREKDKVAPVARYADFLRDRRGDVLGAADQYQGALLWAPEDPVNRAKVADIYLALAKAHYDKREYAGAETRLGQAAKYADAASPQGRMLEDYRQRLSAIRR
jgi:hypothetical protein